MSQYSDLIEKGFSVQSLTATLTKEITDSGETFVITKTVVLTDEDLQTHAKSNAKNDKARIKELESKLTDYEAKRKAVKDEAEKIRAKDSGKTKGNGKAKAK